MDPRFKAWQQQRPSTDSRNALVRLPSPQPLKETINHEGWNLYAQYLEGLRAQYESVAQGHEAALLSGAVDAAVYYQKRVLAAHARGHALAFARALSVIYDLINAGTPPALTDREDIHAP